MITVNITKAKRRFGIPPRKQWRYTIRFGNNDKLSDRDTYANPEDIVEALQKFRDEPVRVRIHYVDGTSVVEL